MAAVDRLFVPLARGPFEDFRDHRKVAELRAYGRNFTGKHVFEGRDVELRLGYSLRKDVPQTDWQLWGKIGRVVSGSLDDIFEIFGFRGICPRLEDEAQAEEAIEGMLGKPAKFIGFEVKLCRTSTRSVQSEKPPANDL